jgi:hypothetical protein
MMMRKRHKRLESVYEQAAKKALSCGAPDHRYVGHVSGGQREYMERDPLRIRTTPICWGIPMDEILYAKFFTMFFRNGLIMPWDTLATTESTYLPDARNAIHDMYLETDFPYLMMLDSDVLIPPLLVEKLMAHDKPIVGGWYANKNRLKAYTQHPIVYDYLSTTPDGVVNWRHREGPGAGLERVDGMGAGCWLMKRETAEKLGASPYDMSGGTEDLKLSKKLLDMSIPLFVDWSLHCPHIGVSWV